MEYFEDDAIKIANYFDGNMSPAEEEKFMESLDINANLREEYENELLIRGLFKTGEDEPITDDIRYL